MNDAGGDERWAARLERERRARRQAEIIAEQGMRELWLANQTLEERVRERTAELEGSLAALAEASRLRQVVLEQLSHELATPLHAIRAGLELIDDGRLGADDAVTLRQVQEAATRLDGVLQALSAMSSVSLRDHDNRDETRRPGEFGDGVVGTWQRQAARRGMLLVGDVSSSDTSVTAPWWLLDVAVAALLDAQVQHGTPGAIHVDIDVVAGDGPEPSTAVEVRIRDAGAPLLASTVGSAAPTPLTWVQAGRRGIGLALVQRLADESVMTMAVHHLPDGSGNEVVLRIPGTVADV